MGKVRSLVISDGGTASLLAAAAIADRKPAAGEERGGVVWVAAPGADRPLMRAAAFRQADLLGLTAVRGDGEGDEAPVAALRPSERTIGLLLRAALDAYETGVTSVIH